MIALGTMTFPQPIVSVATLPTTRAAQERLGQALCAIAPEDPLFAVRTDRNTGETIVSGMSESQLDSIVTPLSRDVGGDLQVGKVQVVYRETVRAAGEGEHTFARRTHGRNQYEHVVLRIEPLRDGSDFVFVNAADATDVPSDFVSWIEKGIREAAETGITAEHPIRDIKVTLVGGSHRPGESFKLDFKIAASMAFKEAARRAQPFLLEPVVTVEVVVPEEFLGEVIGDLSARHGMIQGLDTADRAQIVQAHVRLARMLGYPACLREITHGSGAYKVEFLSWAAVDPRTDPDGNEPVSSAMRAAPFWRNRPLRSTHSAARNNG